MTIEPNSKKIFSLEVVEDNTSLRKVIHDKCILEGFRVFEAHDGEAGLAVAFSEHPDLILLDIVMPKMDGITMMKKVRQEGAWGKQVPIVLLTNLSADDEKIQQAIADNEPAYYLVKSNWTLTDLVEKVRERLYRV
jgi:CheY-like chemotaxis protein